MASFVKWQMRLIEAVKSGDQKTIDYCESIRGSLLFILNLVWETKSG